VLPSLDQNKRSEPDAVFNQFHYIIDYLSSEAFQQRRAGVNKKDIDSLNVQPYESRRRRSHCGNRRHVLTDRLDQEYCREELGSTTKGAAIITSLEEHIAC